MAHLSQGLSVGLIVGSEAIWRWQFQLIQSLIEWRVIAVQQIIVLNQAVFKRNPLVHGLHAMDAAVFRSPVSAFDLVSIDKLSPASTTLRAFLSANHCVDAFIDLSETKTAKSLFKLSRLGVLQPAFDEDGCLKSQTLGLKPLVNREKQVCLSILGHFAPDHSVLIGQIKPSFNRGDFSRNLSDYWVWLTHLWKRGVYDFARSGKKAEAGIDQAGEALPGQSLDDSDCTALSFSEAMCGIGQIAANVRKKFQQKYWHTEQWVLLVKPMDTQTTALEQTDFQSFQELTPPEDCFWADPFVLSRQGKHYVFFEELPFATERGYLSCMELFDDGRHAQPRKIIEEPHHLSYPNVFEYQGDYFLIPESGEAGRVDLYHCTEFPYEWIFSKTLIHDIHAYDATLLEYQGKWWMFTTVVPEKGLSGCEELHIFYSDSPVSNEWKAHSANPVISDASRARPGGNFFVSEGVLYRVSQDCAGQYGAGINLSRVEQLSESAYQETLVSQHYPEWDSHLSALHTFNFNEHFVVADALRVNSKGLFQ